MKRGITLLEVLFSIFVLAVGLLGLAALVPVGKIQVADARHADMSVTLGRSAMYDMMIRDMTDELFWCTRTGATTPSPLVPTNESFALDPMSLAINSSIAAYDRFPVGVNMFPTMRRLTLLEQEGGTVAMRRALAERIFVLNEPTYDTPSDEDKRPTMVNPGADGGYGVVNVDDDGNGTVDDLSEGLWTGSDDRIYATKSDYSWLATITPRGDGLHNVSVVVFYKRDFVVESTGGYSDLSSERVVQATLQGGGDVDLTVPSGDANAPNTVTTAKQASDYLKVRPNQWILLCGRLPAPSTQQVFAWYRVVNVSDLQSTAAPYFVSTTLAGPDAPTFRDEVGSVAGTQVYAVICDGVIGVYERAVKLDEPSLWSSH